VEIYFSMVQSKVLAPNDFDSLAEVELRLRLHEGLTNSRPSRSTADSPRPTCSTCSSAWR
jgi:hypothetical protein